MKLITILLATLLLACTTTESVTGTEIGGNADTNRIQYVIMGNAYSVSIGFCSQMGPRDSVICAIMPWLVEFELPVGETAFMRVHKNDIDDVITCAIVQNGYINVIDTALPGDEMASVEVLVSRGF